MQTARAKLVAVLGPEKGEAALQSALRGAGVETITSVDDLYRVSQALVQQGGFAGAVGAMLSVHAVVRGASPGPSHAA